MKVLKINMIFLPMIEYVVIRYNGYMHKFRKAPQESDENATLRAWYILNELSKEEITIREKESKSHIWLNTKYFGMIYRYGSN